MKVIAIIPARMDSSRFPGKPMYNISGIPMIGHCYLRTKLAEGFSEVYVATCDTEIAQYVKSLNGKVVMTSPNHTRATGRTAEAIEKIENESGGKIEIALMVQGDEPLIIPYDLTKMIKEFQDPDVEIVNLMTAIKSQKAFEDNNNVKVVVKENMDALYFSREPIPSMWKMEEIRKKFMQVGAIAFKRNTLHEFEKMKETYLEKIESVDMNRILEKGGNIKMFLTNSDLIGVDTLEEAKKVNSLMQNDIFFKKYKSLAEI